MREITARFKSQCKKCGGTIAERSVIFYDDDTKSPYHTQCRPPEEAEQPPSREQFELADKMGFRSYSWDLLRELCGGADSGGERIEPETFKDGNSVRSMSEEEEE